MIIGITGGTGCGKTTALEAVAALGGLVLDLDAVYHELLETDKSLTDAIEARFPGTVENGVLQRKKLGAIVFADKNELAALGRITGGAIRKEVMRRLEHAPALTAIDAIGLFEGGYDKLCDMTVAVTAPEEVRIARLMARDGISREYAQSRIAAQKPQSTFSALCDHTLVNDGSREEFYARCLAFFRKMAIIEEKK